MPAEKLTDVFLKVIDPGVKRIEVSDTICRGLRVRISPLRKDGTRGDRTWSFVYREGATIERISLGTYPSVTLAQARLKANELRVLRANGESPAAERRKDKAPRGTWKVEELVDTYLSVYASGKKSRSQYKAFLAAFVSRFGQRDPDSLRKPELLQWLDAMASQAPIAANRVQAHVHALYVWAIDQEQAKGNPLAGVKKRAPEHAKTTVLKPAEIAAMWQATGNGGTTPAAGAALRLILLTGARPGEVVGMRLRELEDLYSDLPIWRLPDARVKSGKSRIVPLSHMAAGLIRERIARMEMDAIDVDHVFPARHNPALPATAAFLPQAVVALRGKLAKDGKRPHWTAHDLRRTAATLASEGGVREEDIAALLGHAALSVTGRVYNQNARLPEMRAAVEVIATVVKNAVDKNASAQTTRN